VVFIAAISLLAIVNLSQANDRKEGCREVVSSAITAMTEINTASAKISEYLARWGSTARFSRS
jgi:hypothetical protein